MGNRSSAPLPGVSQMQKRFSPEELQRLEAQCPPPAGSSDSGGGGGTASSNRCVSYACLSVLIDCVSAWVVRPCLVLTNFFLFDAQQQQRRRQQLQRQQRRLHHCQTPDAGAVCGQGIQFNRIDCLHLSIIALYNARPSHRSKHTP